MTSQRVRFDRPSFAWFFLTHGGHALRLGPVSIGWGVIDVESGIQRAQIGKWNRPLITVFTNSSQWTVRAFTWTPLMIAWRSGCRPE
jgi:hypothetical protein